MRLPFLYYALFITYTHSLPDDIYRLYLCSSSDDSRPRFTFSTCTLFLNIYTLFADDIYRFPFFLLDTRPPHSLHVPYHTHTHTLSYSHGFFDFLFSSSITTFYIPIYYIIFTPDLFLFFFRSVAYQSNKLYGKPGAHTFFKFFFCANLLCYLSYILLFASLFIYGHVLFLGCQFGFLTTFSICMFHRKTHSLRRSI